MDNLDHCFCMFQLTTTTLALLESDSPTGSTRNAGPCTDDFQQGRGGRTVRRVDLIVTPPNQFPFSLLGWTGSKVCMLWFNFILGLNFIFFCFWVW